MDEHVAENLKELREIRLMTQADLAEQAGLDLTTIQRIEAGRPPSKESLKAICAALSVDVEELRHPAGGGPSTLPGLPPGLDLRIDQLVQLDPVRIAKYVKEALRGTHAFVYLPQPSLDPVQEAASEPIVAVLRSAAEMSDMDRYNRLGNALLDCQDEMNNLRAVGLVLALGRATQEVQCQPDADGTRRDHWMTNRTLFATVLPQGTRGHTAIVPRKCDWQGRRQS